MKLPTFAIITAVLVFLAANAFFIVAEPEQALVFQFGEFKEAHSTPGLKVKIPFIQNVIRYPELTLLTEPPAQRVILADNKPLIVDAYAYFRIEDSLKFFQTLRSLEEASENLNDRINGNMRKVLGTYGLPAVLSEKRGEMMREIEQKMTADIAANGLKLIDLRIGRAERPAETSEAVYEEMKAKRFKEARQLRAEGSEEAQTIRAEADKEKTIILAEANKSSQKLRGEGDAQAIKIYAEAFNRDPNFYSFYRSLEAYRNSLADKDTTLVLSPDSEFFEFFKSSK